MAAGPWQVHDSWIAELHRSNADTDTDEFRIRLYNSLSNVNDTAVVDASAVSNELPTAFGYTAGGQVVTVTLTSVGVLANFTCTDASWTATGGDLVARYAAIVDVTANIVVAHSVLDTTPDDVTATSGNPFTVEIDSGGVYNAVQS